MTGGLASGATYLVMVAGLSGSWAKTGVTPKVEQSQTKDDRQQLNPRYLLFIICSFPLLPVKCKPEPGVRGATIESSAGAGHARVKQESEQQ
jgi:hypothetical protein